MKKLLYVSLFAALLAVGCEGAEGPDENPATPDTETPGGDVQQTEIRLSTNIEVLTRAAFPALDTQIAKDENVVVWVDNSTDGSQLYGNNVLTADGNGGLTGGTPMYFPQNNDNADIYALHTNAVVSGSGYPSSALTHTVSTDQRTQQNYAASDLLYAAVRNVAKTNAAVALTFRHLLSKVQVAIVTTDGVTAADISSVRLCGLKTAANFSLNKGAEPRELTVAAGGQAADIAIGTDVSADFTDAGVRYNDAVVVPQAVDEQSVLLAVTLTDGKELVFNAPSDTAFEGGKKYALQVSVSLNGIRLSTDVSDWEPGGDLFPGGNGGNGGDKVEGDIIYVDPCDLAANVMLADFMASHTGVMNLALQAGSTYTLSEPLDFGAREVTVYSVNSESNLNTVSDKHAIVMYGYNGTLRTGNSLTLKNLSIDVSEQVDASGAVMRPSYVELDGRVSPGWGLIEGSQDPAVVAAATRHEYYEDIPNYILNNITIDGCYIKNLPCNLTHIGTYAWAYGNVTVTNSIIQLNNNGHYGDATVFGTYGGGLTLDGVTNWRVGAVRDLLVENSTIYNIHENNKNRMIRWNGNRPYYQFPEGTQASITFNNCTLSQTMTGKEFANSTWNTTDATINFTNNVYRDCFRVLTKMNVGNCNSTITGNLGWWSGSVMTGDGAYLAAGDKENDEQTIENFGGDAAVRWTSFTFGGNVNAQLNFNAADGHGVNFKASAASPTQGDPRWNQTR